MLPPGSIFCLTRLTHTKYLGVQKTMPLFKFVDCKKSFMKRILIGMALMVSISANAQVSNSLDVFNKEKNKTTRTGMTVLTVWGVGNLGWGLIAAGQTSGSNKYFHQMNAMWGGINTALGVLGYLGAKQNKKLSLAGTVRSQYATEKTYILNAGLDLAYIGGGLYLKERAKNANKKPERLKGYGESIILQGAGLFLLDATMFAIHNVHGKKLHGLLEKTTLAVAPGQVGLFVKL